MDKRRLIPIGLWLAALFALARLFQHPLSSRLTRIGTLLLIASVWFGFIALKWDSRGRRYFLCGLTLLLGLFLVLPSRAKPSREEMRADYTRALSRYEGAPYFWGGEKKSGIDCSGLVRRGLIDAFVARGVRTFDAGLVRQSIDLWWHDCTASELAEGHRGLTEKLMAAPSLNTLDSSKLVPGDLAVTANGIHVLAYLGGNRWIEADPVLGKVVIVTAPSQENAWFSDAMTLVRWTALQ